MQPHTAQLIETLVALDLNDQTCPEVAADLLNDLGPQLFALLCYWQLKGQPEPTWCQHPLNHLHLNGSVGKSEVAAQAMATITTIRDGVQETKQVTPEEAEAIAARPRANDQGKTQFVSFDEIEAFVRQNT